MEQSLTAAGQALRDPSALQALAKPEGAVAVVLTPGHIDALPKERLLYYHSVSNIGEVPCNYLWQRRIWSSGNRITGVPPALSNLAQSPDAATRAGALIRLARNLRKNGQPTVALAVYTQSAGIHDATVNGVPVELLALWASCDLIEGAQQHGGGERTVLRPAAR